MHDERIELINTLREELPVLRAKARVSQETVAEKIGISRQTYSSIETGKKEMPWTTFMALVAFFQNNEMTKQMMGKMDGFNEKIADFTDSNQKNCTQSQ